MEFFENSLIIYLPLKFMRTLYFELELLSTDPSVLVFLGVAACLREDEETTRYHIFHLISTTPKYTLTSLPPLLLKASHDVLFS